MFTAIKESDNKKVLGSLIEKDINEKYHCEHCKSEVIHHKSESKIKIGHFKHKQDFSFCPNQTNETEWHFNTKHDIYTYIKQNWGDKLKNIEVEKWICKNSIRSDIYIETFKNKIAIEVQASILSISEIKRRTIKYYNNNIAVLWILPFEFEKFFKKEYLWGKLNKYGSPWDWTYKDKVKFKEMELWLFWAYYKKIIYWELEHLNSDGFIYIEFDNYKNKATEYYNKDGEFGISREITSKTLKRVLNIEYDVRFDNMYIYNCKEFQVPQRDYIIPQRKIFSINNNF